jgi:hypothetical protein
MKITGRWKLKFILSLVLTGLIIGALLFAAGCAGDQAPAEASDIDDNIVNGKDANTVTDEMRAKPEGLPPIDGQIPEELKTVTLAMG